MIGYVVQLDRIPDFGSGGLRLKCSIKMNFTYVLYSQNHDRLYIVMTKDIDRILKEHNSGKNRSTKAYSPWIIIYIEDFETSFEARQKEIKLKSSSGRKWIRKNLME